MKILNEHIYTLREEHDILILLGSEKGEMMETIRTYLETLTGRTVEIVSNTLTQPEFGHMKFGTKTFESVHVEYRADTVIQTMAFVKKLYHGTDVPMILSGDTAVREIAFFCSPLREAFGEFFDIPLLAVDSEQHVVYMRDCTEELRQFGPPVMPTESQVQLLAQRIAEKDASLTDESPSFSAGEYATPVNVLHDIVMNRSVHLKEIRSQWPWFSAGLQTFQAEHAQEWEQFLHVFERTSVEAEIVGIPKAHQHGDFFFSNRIC